jgi:hypothetical protein
MFVETADAKWTRPFAHIKVLTRFCATKNLKNDEGGEKISSFLTLVFCWSNKFSKSPTTSIQNIVPQSIFIGFN